MTFKNSCREIRLSLKQIAITPKEAHQIRIPNWKLGHHQSSGDRFLDFLQWDPHTAPKDLKIFPMEPRSLLEGPVRQPNMPFFPKLTGNCLQIRKLNICSCMLCEHRHTTIRTREIQIIREKKTNR